MHIPDLRTNATQQLESFFKQLGGKWTFFRSFEGTSEHLEGRYCGVAEFVPISSGSYRYHEELKIFPDTSSYKDYQYNIDGNKLVISKVDAGLVTDVFLKLEFNEHGPTGFLIAEGIHYCGNDIYQGRFTICQPDTFLISYVVSGPAKSYTIVTQYDRAPAV